MTTFGSDADVLNVAPVIVPAVIVPKLALMAES